MTAAPTVKPAASSRVRKTRSGRSSSRTTRCSAPVGSTNSRVVGELGSRPSAAQSRSTKGRRAAARSEEHTSELQSLMRISYAVFCLKKKKHEQKTTQLSDIDTTATKKARQ